MVNITVESVGIQGNTFVLDCNPIGQPVPSVTWFRGLAQLQQDSRITVDQSGRLVFNPIFSTDASTYRCMASNSVGTASAETQLSVLGEIFGDTVRVETIMFLLPPPLPSPLPLYAVVPLIQASERSVTVSEGTTAILDCVATGNPTPVVTWFFNSLLLPSPNDPRIQQATNNSLVLAPARNTDEGSYVCQATNVAGTESATIQLRVNGMVTTIILLCEHIGFTVS